MTGVMYLRAIRHASIAHSKASEGEPYILNPLGINPLRRLIETTVDFDRLRQITDPRIFVTAVKIRSGHVKVFRGGELAVEALMASTCEPTRDHAVEIDGEFFWGGRATAPPLFPLFQEAATDIIILQNTPTDRTVTPKDGDAIFTRLFEISALSNLW